jgi:amidase
VQGAVKTLKDVIEFNRQHESRAMPFFKQEILEKSEVRGTLDDKEYKDALKKILTTTRNGIENMLKENRLDAICGPTNGPTWCTDLVNGDFFTGYGMYSPAAIAGFPSISVPMGTVQGLPVGLTFFSKAWEEPALISIAFAYEQASRKRVLPAFLDNLTA